MPPSSVCSRKKLPKAINSRTKPIRAKQSQRLLETQARLSITSSTISTSQLCSSVLNSCSKTKLKHSRTPTLHSLRQPSFKRKWSSRGCLRTKVSRRILRMFLRVKLLQLRSIQKLRTQSQHRASLPPLLTIRMLLKLTLKLSIQNYLWSRTSWSWKKHTIRPSHPP